MKLSYFLVSTLTFYFLLITFWGYQNLGSILFNQEAQLTEALYFKKGIEKEKIIEILVQQNISEKQIRFFSEEKQLSDFSKEMNLAESIEMSEVLQSLTPYVEIAFATESEKQKFDLNKNRIQEYIENTVQANTWTEKFAVFALYFESIANLFFFFVFVISLFVHLTLFKQMIRDRKKEFFIRRLLGQSISNLFTILAQKGLLFFLGSLLVGHFLSYVTYSIIKLKANHQIQFLSSRLNYIRLSDILILTLLFVFAYLVTIYLSFKKTDILTEEF